MAAALGQGAGIPRGRPRRLVYDRGCAGENSARATRIHRSTGGAYKLMKLAECAGKAGSGRARHLLHRLVTLAMMPAAMLLASSANAADVPAAQDPEIARLVREVSPARLETYVRALAGFGTRHSLSVADDPKRGVGAAQRWIRETLDRCAAEPGSRLKVAFDEFVQEPTPRIPKPVSLTNVVATLEGAD